MLKRTYISAVAVAAAFVIACPAAAFAAPPTTTTSGSPAATHTEGKPYAATGADPYAADAATDTDAGADASITIGDNGAVVSSKGLSAAQLTQVRRAVAGPVAMSTTGESAASVSGASIHHTWHWWGLHVWVDYTKSETNYLYYHSWTTAAEVAAVCGVVAAIDGWAGAGCLAAAGIQLGRILDGVDYAHDRGKGLRLDFNINWTGATWITTGTD